jgi:hypothetical protein
MVLVPTFSGWVGKVYRWLKLEDRNVSNAAAYWLQALLTYLGVNIRIWVYITTHLLVFLHKVLMFLYATIRTRLQPNTKCYGYYAAEPSISRWLNNQVKWGILRKHQLKKVLKVYQ